MFYLQYIQKLACPVLSRSQLGLLRVEIENSTPDVATTSSSTSADVPTISIHNSVIDEIHSIENLVHDFTVLDKLPKGIYLCLA